MPRHGDSSSITIRPDKVAEIDALASAMGRTRDDIVNEAIERYLDTNAWQVERIGAGLAAARAGRVAPADEVFSVIAAKHGWSR
jgi:predicted transcriptional regulator